MKLSIINKAVGLLLILSTMGILYLTYFLMLLERDSILVLSIYGLTGCIISLVMLLLGMLFLTTKKNLFNEIRGLEDGK